MLLFLIAGREDRVAEANSRTLQNACNRMGLPSLLTF